MTVRLTDSLEVLLMLTEFVEPKLTTGRYFAPAGVVVIAAVRVTIPVKFPVGVTVIVDIFPVVAPGTRLTACPETVNEG